jgi:F0F1-type ATP synthase membrane subunit b/b'
VEKAIPRTDLRTKVVRCIIAGAAGVALTAAPAQASGALELVPDWFGLLPVLVVAFSLLVLPVNSLIFKPIFRALDERAARIEGARRRADSLRRQTDEVMQRYESSIRTAWSEAESVRKQQAAAARAEQASIAAAARAEAEQKIEQARADLVAARSAAAESLRSAAHELSRAAAESVLGRPIS